MQRRIKLNISSKIIQKKKINICVFTNHFSQARCYTMTYGVMVIVVGIGHGDTSSNPGQD